MSQLKVLVKEMPDDKNLNTTTLIAYWQMGRQSEAINCPFEAKRYYEEGVNFAMLHAPQNKLLRNLDEALARINQRSRPRLKRTRIQCKLMSPSTALIRRSFSSEKKTVRARSQNSRYSKNNESLQTTQRSQIQNIRTAVLPKLKTVPESLQRSIQELNSNISRLEKHIANSPQLKKRFTNSPEIKTARVLATEKVLRRPSTRQLQTWWRDVSRGSRKITSPKIVNAVFRGYKVRRNMKNLSR